MGCCQYMNFKEYNEFRVSHYSTINKKEKQDEFNDISLTSHQPSFEKNIKISTCPGNSGQTERSTAGLVTKADLENAFLTTRMERELFENFLR